MICCNCGRKYDPDSIIDCWYINKKGQKSNISKVKINGQTLAFCKYCIRAVTFGVSAIAAVESNVNKLSEVGIDILFEEEESKIPFDKLIHPNMEALQKRDEFMSAMEKNVKIEKMDSDGIIAEMAVKE